MIFKESVSKNSNTLPSCLWFSSDTTIVLLQCYSNKLLMMCSYEIFCNTWTFLWIPPPSPVKPVSRLRSFDSFVCIVKHWEQYAVRILKKPCFLLCQCVCTVCLRAEEAKKKKGQTLRPKLWLLIFSMCLTELACLAWWNQRMDDETLVLLAGEKH